MKTEELARILVERSSLHGGPFVLASGRTSDFYFDCRLTTTYAPAMPLIGRAFLERFGDRPNTVGGLTIGADPIAGAIAHESLASGAPIHMFSVRKARKEHGTRRWLEGCAEKGMRAVIVDDVATSGNSVIQAIQRAREEGLEVIEVVVLVDREEGGLEHVRSEAPEISVSALFTKTELDKLDAQRS